MIFKQWQQVLDGTKTQTRRPVKENEEFWQQAEWQQAKGSMIGSLFPDAVVNMQGCAFGMTGPLVKWQVGHTYAMQPGMSKKAVGHIKLTAIRREPLREISYVDALAEGMNIEAPLNNYGTGSIAVDAYAELWNNIYRGKKLADGTLLTWAQNPDVWVLTFELVEGITTA